MQTYMKLPDGRDGQEIIIMEKVLDLLPKLASLLAGFLYPILDKTDVQICMMRQIIIIIKRDYSPITLCVIPKLLQIIRGTSVCEDDG